MLLILRFIAVWNPTLSANLHRINYYARLDTLARIDAHKSHVVELRYFDRLTIVEVAEVLRVSVDTAKRDWRMARAWLIGELTSK